MQRIYQAVARTPSEGTTPHTDDLAGSLGLLCVWGANLGETFGEESPLRNQRSGNASDPGAAGGSSNALEGKVLQKTPVLL
jgi:hypothetical protein